MITHIKYIKLQRYFANLIECQKKYNSYEDVAKKFKLNLPIYWYDLLKLNSIKGKYIYNTPFNSPGDLAYQLETSQETNLIPNKLLVLVNGEDDQNIYFNPIRRNFFEELSEQPIRSIKKYLIDYYKSIEKDFDPVWNLEDKRNAKNVIKLVLSLKLP